VETRKIASVGTAAGNTTTLWQPLPDGPVISIPVGSSNVPYTGAGRRFGFGSGGGFEVEVGQKIGIGYGATYPTVAKAVEKYEIVTVAEVGKPGTQAWLSADAKAGDTNIKVSSVENISIGDKIRLDIDSVGHGIETVTVTKVGTASERSTFRGPLADTEDAGTGLDLAEPLKYDHASNMPFSARGTGISFEPMTAFEHSSNEPILPLGTGITLAKPLANDHAIDAVVHDEKVRSAGYQGRPAPDQWFGGPSLSLRGGNMVLRDAAGLVVDSLNYGGLIDPWAAEGYQVTSGAGESGCYVATPSAGGVRFRFGRPGGSDIGGPDMSAGRFPDGADSDSNCHDFQIQTTITLASGSVVGETNIKVASVADFAPGQKVTIDAGANTETAIIATVGTAGGTIVGTATAADTAVIPVEDVAGFGVGQTITIDGGAHRETAIVASIAGGRRGFGRRPGNASITVAAPLKNAHAQGVQVSGSGITLTAALTKAHDNGVPVSDHVPTPGAPNQYAIRAR
jgi:hypothetical protein